MTDIHLTVNGEAVTVKEGTALSSLLPNHPKGAAVVLLKPKTASSEKTSRMRLKTTAGDELVVGWNQLKQELGGNNTPYEIHVHNYIGGDEIDELVLNSNQINNKISGGR